MTMLPLYKNQVELLLDVLPLIQKHSCFALKGGTAINLFHRNMPRLSVDIDLTYLPIETRDVFLHNLTRVMKKLAAELTAKHFQVEPKQSNGHTIKLLVMNQSSTIKIEPNTVLRGSVFPPETRELCQNAQATFLQTQKIQALSLPDLYAGKICAALDRQHPRDLFDIKLLFDHEGITPEIRQAFVIYLASSPRPMNELLSPRNLDMVNVYHKEFVGMTDTDTDYKTLCQTRKQLIDMIQASLTQNERDFLLSLKAAEPAWDLIPIPHIKKLPALRWKLMNIKKMEKNQRARALNKLKGVLDL